jgi:DNA-binding NarL/FixJ family response regulator
VNILLIDDHVLFRVGMVYMLRDLDAEINLDEADNCAQARAHLGAKTYDLVLLDLGLPGAAGLNALDALRKAAPTTPFVVISGNDDPQVVRQSIDQGAVGFIPKSATPEVLIQALRLVLAKGIYLPPSVLEDERGRPAQPAPEPSALAGLTPRQMEVLRGVITGKSNKVIAQELGVSDATIKWHLTLTFRSLGVGSRTEAIYVAAKMGLRLA